jgi:hypothetical protein
VLQAAALADQGDAATLDAHDADPAEAATRLFEAALEDVFLFESVPVEPRLERWVLLAGGGIGRDDAGPVESLASLDPALPRLARAALSGDPALVARALDEALERGPSADADAFARRIEAAVRRLRNRLAPAPDALPAFVAAALRIAAGTGYRVPAPVLAAGRWLAAAAAMAARLDPEVDLAAVTQAWLARREIEALFELPTSGEAASRWLSLVAPLQALPGRLDRLLSDAASDHYRLPVEAQRAPVDRAFEAARLRLLCAALLWLGAALLLVVARALPAGLVRTSVSAGLWIAAASGAAMFAWFWRRVR